MKRLLSVLLAGLLVVGWGVMTSSHADDCTSVSMVVTATPLGGGLYEYTVTGTWDVAPRALSHLDFFLDLENCACVCEPGIVSFGSPAGTSTGADGDGNPCTVDYLGDYLCMGDASIPPELSGPTVKFEPEAGQNCEPETQGSGTWSFTSLLPPAPASVYPDAVAIKHGGVTCTGDLSGQLPMCDCTVPTNATTWGTLKSIYH